MMNFSKEKTEKKEEFGDATKTATKEANRIKQVPKLSVKRLVMEERIKPLTRFPRLTEDPRTGGQPITQPPPIRECL